MICTVAAVGARAADAGFRTLDLKPIVNMGWRDEIWGDGKGGWTDQGDNDLRQIGVGRRELLGIPCELIDPASNGGKAVLTLGSKKFPAGPLTATAEFGGKARSLYFVHAAAWGEGLQGDERLADGTVKHLGIWELNKVKPEKTARAQDQLRFYFELNNAYFQKTKNALRAAGVRQPICGTGWFGVGAGFYARAGIS